ncbi:MAG: bifunctional transcriptional activator/DNA repair enzyme AdaA [Gemmatimonadales bacterium]
MPTLPPLPEMIGAYRRRDASYDGIFLLGVRTTGIFCRPSCPARKPLPRNVEFFPGAREALFAGFRPCKRCRPMEAAGAAPAWIRPLLKRVEANPQERIKEQDLRSMGIDPARARRWFLKTHGMTFHAYARGRRLNAALNRIRTGADLDEVILGHGFESHSGFRDAFARLFGQAPGRSRNMDNIVVSWIESPLGPLVAGATGEGLCLLEFTDRRMLETQFDTLRRRFGCPVVPGEHPLLDQLKHELSEYFAGRLRRFTLPLVYPGTEFQRKVWSGLLEIPYGETRSYEQLAWAVGAPGAQRAVGHANGLNRIAIVIPCHRVVNKDGKLGGYGGGLWRKQLLLDLERGGQVGLELGERVRAGGER